MKIKLSKRFIILFFFLQVLLVLPCSAQDTFITNGLTWLYNNQNIDGSWGNQDFTIIDTTEAVNTLKYLNNTGGNYTLAISWLSSQQNEFLTDELSRTIKSLAAESDTSALAATLVSYKIADGGWGLSLSYGISNPFDTSLALQALKAVNYSDQTVISSAITYLKNNQNSDGGFGFYSGDDGNVYMSALVLETLSQFKSTYSLQTAIDNGVSYLLTQQNTDGGFGTGGGTTAPTSTVYETALSIVALIDSGQGQAQPLQDAIN